MPSLYNLCQYMAMALAIQNVEKYQLSEIRFSSLISPLSTFIIRLLNLLEKKCFFLYYFWCISLKYMVSKKGKKIDFMLLSVTDRSRLSNWILAVKKLRIAKIDKNSSGYTRLHENLTLSIMHKSVK